MSALRIVVSVVLLVMQVFQVRTLVEQRFGIAGGSSASAGSELREPVSRVPILVADPDLVRLLSDGWHVSPIGGSSFARLPGVEEATGETGTPPDSSPRAVAMIHGPDSSGAEDTVLIYGCPCILGVTEPAEKKAPEAVSGELPVLLLPRGYVMKVMTNLPVLKMDAPDLEDLGLRH